MVDGADPSPSRFYVTQHDSIRLCYLASGQCMRIRVDRRELIGGFLTLAPLRCQPSTVHIICCLLCPLLHWGAFPRWHDSFVGDTATLSLCEFLLFRVESIARLYAVCWKRSLLAAIDASDKYRRQRLRWW